MIDLKHIMYNLYLNNLLRFNFTPIFKFTSTFNFDIIIAHTVTHLYYIFAFGVFVCPSPKSMKLDPANLKSSEFSVVGTFPATRFYLLRDDFDTWWSTL